MKQALILQFETMDDLAEQIKAIGKGFDNAMRKTNNSSDPGNRDEISVNEHGEVDGSTLEMLLLKKGYRAKSFNAKKKICERLFVQATKRGTRWNYRLSDIDKIPARKSRSKLVQLARRPEMTVLDEG